MKHWTDPVFWTQMNKLNIVVCLLVVLSSVGRVAAERNHAQMTKAIEEATREFESGNFQKSYEIVLPFAQAGNADAQFTIGYLIGNGVGYDTESVDEAERDKVAVDWIRRAARQHHREAIVFMADAYKYGWSGLPENHELSECWRASVNSKARLVDCVTMEISLGIVEEVGEGEK